MERPDSLKPITENVGNLIFKKYFEMKGVLIVEGKISKSNKEKLLSVFCRSKILVRTILALQSKGWCMPISQLCYKLGDDFTTMERASTAKNYISTINDRYDFPIRITNEWIHLDTRLLSDQEKVILGIAA